MRNFYLFCKNFAKALFLVFGILKFKLTKKAPNKNYRLMLNSFYIFGGILNNFGSLILKKRKINLNNRSGLLSKFTQIEISQYEKHLKEYGYVVIENVLDETLCEEILQMSLSIEGKNREMDATENKIFSGRYNRDKPSANRFEYGASELINQKLVQKILADESLVSFAQEYLGGEPILDFISMWWHAPYTTSADKNAAQWFHFDMERTKWIKFFFYITDVDTDSGPHTFIPKTHSTWGSPTALRKKGYSRLSDNEVSKYFPRNTWREFTGKRGTLIVEDTRGLHKGKHCIKGDRLLFQTEYTVSNFGAEVEIPVLLEKNMVSEFKNLHNKYPNIFSMVQIK